MALSRSQRLAIGWVWIGLVGCGGPADPAGQAEAEVPLPERPHVILVVLDTLRSAPCDDVDAVVLSGTGLPTLPVLDKAQQLAERPVLASNVCLAEALLRLLPIS